MNNEKKIESARKAIVKVLSKYILYAGRWHDSGCWFVSDDTGVCNCNCGKNAKDVNSTIRQTFQSYGKWLSDELRGEEREENTSHKSNCVSCALAHAHNSCLSDFDRRRKDLGV